MDNIEKYDNILILSGAGMGIDSGLPDYDGVHRMVDEAAQRYNIEPFMIEHPNFIMNIQELYGEWRHGLWIYF